MILMDTVVVTRRLKIEQLGKSSILWRHMMQLFPSYPLTKTAKESLAGSLRQNACPNSRKEKHRGEGWRLNWVREIVRAAVDPGQASTAANTFRKCSARSVWVFAIHFLTRLFQLCASYLRQVTSSDSNGTKFWCPWCCRCPRCQMGSSAPHPWLDRGADCNNMI